MLVALGAVHSPPWLKNHLRALCAGRTVVTAGYGLSGPLLAISLLPNPWVPLHDRATLSMVRRFPPFPPSPSLGISLIPQMDIAVEYRGQSGALPLGQPDAKYFVFVLAQNFGV